MTFRAQDVPALGGKCCVLKGRGLFHWPNRAHCFSNKNWMPAILRSGWSGVSHPLVWVEVLT